MLSNTHNPSLYRSLAAALFACVFLVVPPATISAQTSSANQSQSLLFAGLRSVASKGAMQAVAVDAAGNLFLLFDQGDGIRVLKTSNDGIQLLGQAHIGAAGDLGTALALDPSGNVYITGTSSSGTLIATAGAAITSAAPGTTSSFVAGFNSSLTETFLTFTGGTRIAASAIAVSTDAVFVSGITYGVDLPVTLNAVQPGPATGSSQNGFVERFSTGGSTLVYATYVTGAGGDTTPTAIATDALDDIWIVGSTSSPGFASVDAVVPVMISSPSGFLMRLSAAGDGIVFSTFVPGAGLSSIALDSTGQTLLLSGAVSLGQFPVDTALAPLVPTTYQTLLRMPLDGSSVASSVVIAPGLQSTVATANDGAAWVSGSFSAGAAPLLPQPALANLGNGYAVRLSPDLSASSRTNLAIDQTVRLGGLANQQQSFAAVPVLINSLAVDPSNQLFVAGSAQPTASATLLSTETYDLPLRGGPTPALPSILRDAVPSLGLCNGSLCAGSAGFLAGLSIAPAPALTFSVDDLPFVTLRNLGSSPAQGLQLTTSAGSLVTNCPGTLVPAGECGALLQGGTPGVVTAAADDAASSSVAFAAYSAGPPASSLIFSPKELDFGIQTSGSAPAVGTISITNLGSTDEVFASAASAQQSNFLEQSTDCLLASSGLEKLIAAGSTCHVTIGFTASANPFSDGFVQSEWNIGSRQVFLTGYSQSAALSMSAPEIDFGTEYQAGLLLPRYLFLSNSSSSPIIHAPVALPPSSPFTVTDGCPGLLTSQSVCRIRIDYLSAVAPSTDSVTLALDQGLQILVTGQTLPAPNLGGGSNPSLSVSPLTATFGNDVVVTEVSNTSQTLAITNTGNLPLSPAFALTGDFLDNTTCGTTLAPGAGCAVSLQFAPSQPGSRSGLLTITTGPSTAPVQVTLSGEATPMLLPNNGTLSFPDVPVGQPLIQFYKITQAFPTLSVAATGPFRVALVEDNGFGHGTPPISDYVTGASGSCLNCWLAIRFQPTAPGAQTGTLTFASAPDGKPYSLGLIGSGWATTGVITSPSLQDFGGVPVHSTSGTVLLTVTNASNPPAPATFSAPAITGDFTLVSPPNGGTPCSGVLAPGASCFAAISFTPGALGRRTGSVTFADSAGFASISLTGTGTPDPGIAIVPFALSFSDASSSTPQTITLTNTGASAIQVATPSLNSSNFIFATACGTLAPASSCSIQVTFLPSSKASTDALTIPVTFDVAGGVTHTASYTVPLSGTATEASLGLYVFPESLAFGPAAALTVGPIRQFTIANTTAKNLLIGTVFPPNFLLIGPPCTALPASSSCDFQLQFVPLTNGDIAGTITVTGIPGDGSSPLATVAYAQGFGVGTSTLTLTGGLIVQGVFDFGSVAVGRSTTQVFTLTNDGLPGSPPLNIRGITSNPPFLSTSTCIIPLQAGANCTVSVTYTPSGETSSSSGNNDVGSLIIESDAETSPALLDLKGHFTGSAAAQPTPVLATFTLSQGSLTFAPAPVGSTSAEQTLTLSNTGTVPLQVSSLNSTADFSIQNECSAIAPGDSCTVAVASTPQTLGVRLAALEISSNAASSLDFVSLRGVGQSGPLIVQPTALAFGSVLVGQTSTLTLQVTNAGSVAVAISQVSATGDYTASSACPQTLVAGASCSIQVSFAPTAIGSRNGTFTILSSAASSPNIVDLTGTGLVNADFALTVNGSSSATMIVVSGQSAVFPLLLTPVGSFNGSISLSCTALGSAPNASCALLPSLATLSGSSANALATITTILTVNGMLRSSRLPLDHPHAALLAALLPALLLVRRRTGKLRFLRLASCLLALVGLTGLSSCGSGNSSSVLYTPPGTYQFIVAANSTTPTVITHSVQLTIVVTSR